MSAMSCYDNELYALYVHLFNKVFALDLCLNMSLGGNVLNFTSLVFDKPSCLKKVKTHKVFSTASIENIKLSFQNMEENVENVSI